MIQRLTEQETAISQVLKADKKTRHLASTWQEMEVLESVSKTLSPLTEFTDALSGEEYISVSYLKPVLHLFNNTVLNPAQDDTDLTKNMKRAILQYLNEKYSDPATDDLLDMASLLDPRFKATCIADDRKEYIKTNAAAEIQSLLERQATSTEESPQQTREAAEGGAAETEADPLEWWRLHQVNFPRVASLARKYLCIPATSAPSERAFSTGGNIVTCNRSALKPETVDRLVFLANNL